MTLLELMVAMLILLVGIWTIAAGFPTLLASITSEGQRTQMARLAERNMERLKDTEGALPWAISGDPTISPYSEPEDLTDPSRPANGQESLRTVTGESFQIPGAQPSGGSALGSSAYVLQQGPAECADFSDPDEPPFVYVLVPLTEQRIDPAQIGGAVLANSFYVDPGTGEITVPNAVYTYDGPEPEPRAWTFEPDDASEFHSGLLVNYAWAETATSGTYRATHYVQDERIVDRVGTGSTRTFAARATSRDSGDNQFACLLEGATSVQAIFYFYRDTGGNAEPTTRRNYVLNGDYGVELRFHPYDAGMTAYVDYVLRDVESTNGIAEEAELRKLMMIEDHVINSEAVRTDEDGNRYTDIKLTAGNIHDERPLFENDLEGGDLDDPVYVLAIDLTDGQIYRDGVNMTLSDDGLSPELENGFTDGLVAVRIGDDTSQEAYVGHTWRFYYSTLDCHNVQLQKPARSFVDIYTAETYNGSAAERAQVDYRTYQVNTTSSDVTDMDHVSIEFVAYIDETTVVDSRTADGHTISVDYVWYDDSNTPHPVYGEMHTVVPGSSEIALQNLSYHSTTDYAPPVIMAVRGVSARTLVWWLTRKGRQQHVALDSFTLKGPLGFTHRVR